MNPTNTGLLQRTISKVTPNSRVQLLLEVIFLFALGALAAVLHARLRIPLSLPGRHGMIFMAVIILGRMTSGLTSASFISCLGASTLMLSAAFSFGDPFNPLIYMGLGIFLDMAYRFTFSLKRSIFLMGLLAGITWMGIPAFRLLIGLFTQLPLHSLRHGPVVPFLSHFVFGFAGGVLGFFMNSKIK
ncbi:MAG: hypothetical protein NTU44_17905 [Bacteroidetes bacterium]|nr:hypothetical protein [Bacteroidota bacterium]